MKRILFSCFGLSLLSHAAEWELQPLKYNQEGLIVDLGVGLWAWPMPMDYDGDGDFDLVVSCPDKPTNGFYYFENTTQDAKVKMPVFRAGVHLGKTGHNVQVSYVDGTPRVLRENYEYRDFLKKGFTQQEKIYPERNFHKSWGQTRAHMWRYLDWEGDGDQDLIVGLGDWSDYEWDHAYDAQGRWRNGDLHGWVYLIENENGTYSDHPVKVEAGGAPVDVYGWPSPNFGDFDDDGDLDLLCGEFLDGFTYFENVGTRGEPKYSTGVRLLDGKGERLAMHVQMITPTAFDWDRDGDLDLIVGDEDGRVALVENVSVEGVGVPQFLQPVYFQEEADELKFGALATPFAHDWDGDGDEDILSGNTAGNIGFFENMDGKGTKWAAPKLLEVDGVEFRIMAGKNGSIQGPAEAKWGYTTLAVADWDDDGRDDILVNSIWPKLQLLRRTKEGGLSEGALPFWSREAPPSFYWWQGLAENLQTQWRTTPIATDFDDDGLLDLVILDQEGYLTCQSRKWEETRVFLDENLRPIRLNQRSAGASGRVKLAVVDWDGDGRLDILMNSENATWWRNCRDAGQGKVVLKKIGNLAKRNVAGHTSSPAVCDFDGNGKPDLLVGSENGKIYFIRHEDCVTFDASDLGAGAPVNVENRFPGLVQESFLFTKAPHKSCHASTIVETSRGLVAAWFGGSEEGANDVGIWSSYHDGLSWSKPRLWADGVQHEALRYPCWNPVLFQESEDAPTRLFFKVGPNPREWWGEVMESVDRGRSFQLSRRLPEGILGPVRSKPLLQNDGSLLCPTSTEVGGDWRFHFEILDNGRWNRVEPKEQDRQVIQPTLLKHPSGKVQALYRSKHGLIFQNESSDGGISWSPLETAGLPNNNAGIEALTLFDGRHLLLYSHLKKGRHALHLAVSQDGKQWRAAAVMEQSKNSEFSYPAMIQRKDGRVELTYTWNRTGIRHFTIDPDRLQLGSILTEGDWPD
ncbi:exo-alpha-sialidase [Akkermansiaceae bacterium]|nr:exo-alpha-sialidase [Akkermansiaceae bacterium]